MTPPLALIVAVAENGVIGNANSLPWHISSDLKRFRALTMGKPLIMGRKTYQSIGRVLPGREMIVVTHDATFAAPQGVHHVPSIEAALELAVTLAAAMGADEIMVAGGAEIFAQLMDRCDRMYVTFVAAAPAGDAYLSAVDWSRWWEVRREDHAAQNGDDVAFSFVDFIRPKT